ncbi:PIN domain-containing protein [Bisgaard Taxon 10/6]|uniref:PIN domain-containing protein n=1 Tax=Exercitatus varius TaxID=67857 RepID=UPI00294AFEC1|nr:PIN domain-containing protein [Exercitatus varius]MDG2948212.1 PIN domain-containing protein [Exercitatus varius]
MNYAFIDYENLNSLDGLELQSYERVFLFLGAKQGHIKLSGKFNDEINMTLITVKNVSENNVDFHIAYYLGKLDATVDKSIEFHVLSKDKGYDGLCHFVKHQREARVCSRKVIEAKPQNDIEPKVLALPSPADIEKEKVNQIFQEYKSFMAKREKRHLPAKLLSLQNNIHNQTSLKSSDKQKARDVIAKVIGRLSQEKLLKVTDTKVSYP